jgi:hypothetical protein
MFSVGRLWYGEPNAIGNAIEYAKFFSRSHTAVIRVYDGRWKLGGPLDGGAFKGISTVDVLL